MATNLPISGNIESVNIENFERAKNYIWPKITKWISELPTWGKEQNFYHFNVLFFKYTEDQKICCEVVVYENEFVKWEGYGESRNLKLAFSRGLDSLMNTSNNDLRNIS